MPPAPRVLHLATGDPVGVYAVETWLRARDLPAVVCHEALECAALMLSEPDLTPDVALIGAAWLDASEHAIIDYVRERWPAIRIIVYGRDAERLLRRGDSRSAAASSESLAGELERLTLVPRPAIVTAAARPVTAPPIAVEPEPAAEIGKNCTSQAQAADEIAQEPPLSEADWDAQVEAELAAARQAAAAPAIAPETVPVRPAPPAEPVPPVSLGGPLDSDAEAQAPAAARAPQTLLTREELAALLRDDE
jgi:hypothetical protein